ncbi:MAG TPA: pinensin family lanthipeptide [Longimicrobium sp.]|nr:pinensin family lanthipeptide [Longimicrobium sp.]
MKKLKIEDLSIESFETASTAAAEGTVVAHASKQYTCNPADGTCFGYTCYETCAGTCADSCAYTCDPAVGTCFGYTCAGAGC